MTIVPMTELEAVNVCLTNLGEEPVNSLTGDIPLDAAQALAVVREITLEVEKRGWYFNTEFYKLSPDNNGHVHLPANTLKVRTHGESRGTPVVQRGTKLYNMTPYNHGFVFDAAVNVRLVLGLPFSDLPQTARSYISIRAARTFQIRQLGDEMNARDDQNDEKTAHAELEQEQVRMAPLSLRDSVSVSAALSQRPTLAISI